LVGPGGSHFQGWLITDVGILNALRRTDWEAIFGPGQICRIFAEHVIEHWSEDEFREFLRIAAHFLAPTGNIRIAVPDGFHPDRAYIDAVKPGGTGPGADDHKVLYDYQTLESILSEANWSYDLLEYFDERGIFHGKAWDTANGFVERSERHDPRNEDHPLSFTSLIVDLAPMTKFHAGSALTSRSR